MHASDLVEMICAVHLSSHVDAPFQERGGLMLVGPPGVLKTTFIEVLDKTFNDAVMVSDINAQTLMQLRDAIASGTVRTLVLPELQKVYERHLYTASNVEGALRALTSEGFQAASFEDQRVNRLRARAAVIAALPPSMQTKRFTQWEESGFNRRFLWSLIRLADPGILERAVVEWRRLSFQLGHVPRAPMTGEKIPNDTTASERSHLRQLVKYQPGGSLVQQLQLLTKCLAVLRWWYKAAKLDRDPMQTIEAFGVSLGREGATVQIEEPTKQDRRRESKRDAGHAAEQLARRRWKRRRVTAKRRKKR